MSSKPRKTVKVNDLILRANRILAASATTADERVGIIHLLDGVLHEANAYHGYNYLPSEFDPDSGPDGPFLRHGYDDTRRRYYTA